MPDLKVQGKTWENFGKYLPTPIIEFVGIRNDSLEVQVSLYFDFTDLERNTQTFLEYFNDPNKAPLYVTIAYVIGETEARALIDKKQTDIFKELYQGADTAGPWSASFLLNDENTGYAKNANFGTMLFDVNNEHWKASNQNFYTDDNKKIEQFTRTLTLPFDINNKTFEIANLNNNIFATPTTGPNTSLHESFEGSITVFAFSSWCDPNDAFPGGSGVNSWDPAGSQPFPVKTITISDKIRKGWSLLTKRSFDSIYIDLMEPLVKHQVSNIAYQQVFKNGNAYTDPEIVFIDGEGTVYNHTPILSIDGKYYKQDGNTLANIRNDFQSLIPVSGLIEENSQLDSILKDIATTLEVYGESSELLIRLNVLRSAIPEKSTATRIGRFYKIIKDRFFRANEAVVSGTQVIEQLIHTSKVRDLRTILQAIFVPGSQQQVPVIFGRNRGFNEGLVTALKIWEYGADEESDESILVRNGFWFFDYEEALQNYSNLAAVFSLEGLANKYGSDLAASTFRVKEALVDKWIFKKGDLAGWLAQNPGVTEIDDSYLDWISRITSKIEYEEMFMHSPKEFGPRTSEIKINTINTHSANYQTQKAATLKTSLDGPPVNYLSYVMLRGVDALADSQLEGSHGLMTFQFQDVEKGFESSYSGPNSTDLGDMDTLYSFEVRVEDTGKKIIESLTGSFIKLFEEELTPYYELASENCSYNNVDGKFNSFFTEGVMNYYSNVESTKTPWVQAAAHFITFRDMTTNAYGGDTEEMAAAARSIVGKINPVNGNLEDLTIFYNNYKEFADLYMPEGEVWQIVDQMDEITTIRFGDPGAQHGDNTKVQYFPLPTPVPITTDALTMPQGCTITSCPEGQVIRLNPNNTNECMCVEEPDPIIPRKKRLWSGGGGYVTWGGSYSAKTWNETLTQFEARMEQLFIDVLAGCGTCAGWHGSFGGTRSGGWLEPDQIYAAVSDEWLSKPWEEYYDEIQRLLRWSVEKEEYKDALIEWCRWAWENCDKTSHGRPGTGLNWQHYIMDANLWGYGLVLDEDPDSGGASATLE
tara:strand:+ start:1282 stop:4404 length:3123 start_codon:yes stop_codon:yes gene_type:complete